MWKRRLAHVWPETAGALVIWIAASAGVTALAPTLAHAPATPAAAAVATAFAGVGVLTGRLLPARYGIRLGIAVVVVGQLLDVALVLAADGLYPRTDDSGSGRILLLLLAGYAGFLLGTLVGDRSSRTTPTVASPPNPSDAP
ncbi:hypothetical protein FGW37_30130 [Streptomyces rectiverticillatus]|uniref:hypothetical protein n=1 Tax=Streptomyces rectiverticillatus TaxID=173860 RepID=UPI0015C3B920|nr:hypothetical protein [Streptomyces rectiverticillatus]QLE75281.1 hypothetical protein FGW37_30130 [Streptomyces rectiverticillatus]